MGIAIRWLCWPALLREATQGSGSFLLSLGSAGLETLAVFQALEPFKSSSGPSAPSQPTSKGCLGRVQGPGLPVANLTSATFHWPELVPWPCPGMRAMPRRSLKCPSGHLLLPLPLQKWPPLASGVKMQTRNSVPFLIAPGPRIRCGTKLSEQPITEQQNPKSNTHTLDRSHSKLL